MTKRKSQNPRYDGHRITNLASLHGLKTRFVEWYNPKVGRKRTVACAFEIFVAGAWQELCRYDSCHGVFHRHRAGWPRALSKRDLEFRGVPMGERGATALNDVKENAAKWIKLIPKEVIDNEATG